MKGGLLLMLWLAFTVAAGFSLEMFWYGVKKKDNVFVVAGAMLFVGLLAGGMLLLLWLFR